MAQATTPPRAAPPPQLSPRLAHALPIPGRDGATAVPGHFVWLVWSGTMFVCWASFFARFPNLRRPLLWGGLVTTPLGITQGLFFGTYWQPPSVLHTRGLFRLDLESFLFCFALGGVAAVLFNAVLHQPISIPEKTFPMARRQQRYVSGLAVPIFAYLPLTMLTGRPLWSGFVVMLAGAVVRCAHFPSLRRKTLIGGILFMFYYALMLAALELLSPTFIQRFWSTNIPGFHIGSIPLAEPLFGLGMGIFWSGLYEQVIWIFSPATPQA